MPFAGLFLLSFTLFKQASMTLKKRRLASGTATRVTHASIVTRWALIWSFSSERHGMQTDGFSGIFNDGFINKPSWEVVQFKTSLCWIWPMLLCPAAHFWCCPCTDTEKNCKLKHGEMLFWELKEWQHFKLSPTACVLTFWDWSFDKSYW